MNATELNRQLDTYLGLREALGLKLRVERPLLRDFVRFVQARTMRSP